MASAIGSIRSRANPTIPQRIDARRVHAQACAGSTPADALQYGRGSATRTEPNRNGYPIMTATETLNHTLTVKALKDALARVSPAIATRSSIEVLTCVRIGDGMLTATDMVATIGAPLPALAGFESVLASAADLKKVLSACKPADSVTLERVEGSPASGWIEPVVRNAGERYESTTPGRFKTPAVPPSLALETPNGRVVLPGFDLEDWPKTADQVYTYSFACADPAGFASTLQDVASIASNDESRPILCSTLLEVRGLDARIVATDSYRLAVDIERGRHHDAEPFRAHLPFAGKYLAKFASIDYIEATDADSAEGGYVRVADESGVTCTLRQTAGQFPSCDQLIPNAWEHRVDVPAGLAAAVKFAGKVAAVRNNPLRLAFDADGFNLSASVQDGPSTSKRFDSADREPYGSGPRRLEHGIAEHLTIGFNADFLQDGLKFVGEESTLSLISALRPGLLTSGARESRVYLIMPVRLPE